MAGWVCACSVVEPVAPPIVDGALVAPVVGVTPAAPIPDVEAVVLIPDVEAVVSIAGVDPVVPDAGVPVGDIASIGERSRISAARTRNTCSSSPVRLRSRSWDIPLAPFVYRFTVWLTVAVCPPSRRGTPRSTGGQYG